MIGSRLKNIREALNLTQKTFAELLNISPQALSHYANSQRDLPNHLFKQIVDKFNINANWLLTGSGSMLLTDTPESGECQQYKELLKTVEQLQSNLDLLRSIIKEACSQKDLAEKKNTG